MISISEIEVNVYLRLGVNVKEIEVFQHSANDVEMIKVFVEDDVIIIKTKAAINLEIDSLIVKIDRVIMVIRIINLVMIVKIDTDNLRVIIKIIFIMRDLVNHEND